MFASDPKPAPQYRLLDFGGDEKLESFHDVVVRRETPSAIGNRQAPNAWANSDLRYQTDVHWSGKQPPQWSVELSGLKFALRCAPSGQVGVFPEQADNWDWIAKSQLDFSNLKALNLFAYTGGTSLALAARGAQVVHVDAAKSVVNWARDNAKLNGLADSSIRWIVEDSNRFVERELKRGNHYDIVIADPPSFGRGPNGESWKIQRDLDSLIENLGRLSEGRCQMILLSCHTPGIDHHALNALARQFFPTHQGNSQDMEMYLTAASGKKLASGRCFRWQREIGINP